MNGQIKRRDFLRPARLGSMVFALHLSSNVTNAGTERDSGFVELSLPPPAPVPLPMRDPLPWGEAYPHCDPGWRTVEPERKSAVCAWMESESPEVVENTHRAKEVELQCVPWNPDDDQVTL
ncbi:hypothetical protein PTE30175_03638 [Pandoraea terrae]|uniref:Uncharacterized protein n=1 Tax=Pandoraea terrae TaxID=1537710 RepID=A0A5E4X8J4_9BURK|nr:hypothetical protein [Pandoraea terrae]VVE32664.1 hypothetical protein PTE30175_03638 [Pandoraea terrae]